MSRMLRCGSPPLWSGDSTRLIGLWWDILRQRRTVLVGHAAGGLSTLQELKACLDMHVRRIQLSSTLVSVQSVGSLVVAGLVERTKIIPDFRNVGVEANGTRVRVESISVLVDLVVEYADGAPKGRIAAVAIDGLLVGLVGLGVLLLSHVASSQEIPALSIRLVGGNGLLQVLNSELLAAEASTLLVM